MPPVGGLGRLAHTAAAAQQEATGVVEPVVEADAARIGVGLAAGQDRLADIVRERPGRDLERVGRDDGLFQLWPKLAGVAVGRQHDALCGDRGSVRRGHDPLVAPIALGALKLLRNRLAVHDNTGADRGLGQRAGVGERLHHAGAAIEPGAGILIGPDVAFGGGLVEHLDRRAALLPLRRAGFQRRHRLGREGALDPARARVGHVHLVLVDQFPHEVGRAADEVDQPRSALGPEHRLELVGIELQPRDHLAAVAARAAEARLLGLQHHRLDAALREMQRGREAAVARAHDADVGHHRLLQGRRRHGRWRGRRPQRRFEREGFGHIVRRSPVYASSSWP